MLFQSWVGAEQHNIHHKQPIMPITMWQISSLCLSQVVQYQTIHTYNYSELPKNLQKHNPSPDIQAFKHFATIDLIITEWRLCFYCTWFKNKKKYKLVFVQANRHLFESKNKMKMKTISVASQ